MSNQVAVRESSAPVAVAQTTEDVFAYLDMIGLTSRLNDNEKRLFAMKCITEGLNPHKGEIYPIVYGSGNDKKVSMITAYHVFIKKAERTGLLAHWRVWTEGSIETRDLRAFISIERHDWTRPFEYDVDFVEFKKSSPLWSSMPKQMLKKCAIGNGFRLAFPEDCAGLYLEEEMPSVIDQTVAQAPVGQNTMKQRTGKTRSQALAEKIKKDSEPVYSPEPEGSDIEDAVTTSVSEALSNVLRMINEAITDEEFFEAAQSAKGLEDESEKSAAREAYRLRDILIHDTNAPR